MARVVIAGGGPAGMMAAIRAARPGNFVTLIEKNPTLGKKLLLTGKGRCNLTNTCGLDDFLLRFSGNAAFLRDTFKTFFNKELISFFRERGVKIKIERQNRVFPVADSSASILNALKKELNSRGVDLMLNTALSGIDVKGGKVKAAILSNRRRFEADKLILALGGSSYSFTGSCGDGYRIAKRLGHTIKSIKPGLVPLNVRQAYISGLEGLSLKNIQLKFSSSGKSVKSDIGELLFTCFGVSGPLVLTLSGKALDMLEPGKGLLLEIDLKPALSIEKLDARMQREFKASPKKSIRNILKAMLPQRLISVFLDIAGIDAHLKAAQITREDRKRLGKLFKSMCLDITGSPGIERAMITRGGIELKEVDPRTMASKLINGLYFCGEILDIAADTGGFNLQAAFSTGYIAGS
jgi:predicted Rossmann fold flavoprotein